MKNRISTGWNFMRILRLAIGGLILFQGIERGEVFFIALGGLFSLLPILNMGCNGTSACGVPNSKIDQNTEEEDITYEEVR